jgi:hypothetical protein
MNRNKIALRALGIALIFLAETGCNGVKVEDTKNSTHYEEPVKVSGDTINVTDVKGNKQGLWIEQFTIKNRVIEKTMFFKDNLLNGVYSEQCDSVFSLSGEYKNGKREGIWKVMINGQIDSILFSGDRSMPK